LDRNAGLHFFVLACRINGLPPGAYEFEPQFHELRLLRRGLTQEEMVGLFVQDDFADAPCIVWISGNLDQACRMYGAAGHRRLLLRAGAAGHRVLMAAMGLGLGGSMIAGLVPDAARQVIGLNGFDRASLFAIALGYELEVQIAT
jgi:SagB-type dehydrogenase family enzyme